MNDIAVFYLARREEGFIAFERFAESYRSYPAGIDHDLVLIAKGFSKPGEFAALEAVFSGLPHIVVNVDDDCGLDIHAYKEAATLIKNPAALFLNTFSVINSADWLKKFYDNFNKPDVGIVGATSSYESLYSSWRLIHKITWLGTTKKFLSRKQVGQFLWLCKMFNARALKSYRSRRARFRQFSGSILYHNRRQHRGSEQFEANWEEVIAPGAPYGEVATFPSFPNPHIRSNAFMISRDRFLQYEIGGKGKMDCCRFESGPDGITTIVRREGLKALVVGADGIGYDVANWPFSGCFRTPGQKNLLIRDNQTFEFDAMSAAEQKSIMDMTWGGYLSGGAPTEKFLLGVNFSNRGPIEKFKWNIKRDKSKSRLFSIVIPCRDRVDLLADAIKTITQQGYDNIEICVFDNASQTPIASVLETGNNNIRIERSEIPLHVTDSWNSAMNMATGDYVTFIGDDDGLLPEFFERISSLADNFADPDVIFYSLYQFVHPGVNPNHREGYVATLPIADFMTGEKLPFILPHEVAKTSVDNSLNFRRSFHFNMPAFTARRDFLNSIRADGQVFRPAFPDYYFANVMLEKAKTIVAEPRYLAMQGISKVSFGYTIMNQTTDDGFKWLGELRSDAVIDSLRDNVVPTSRYQTEYLFTMGHLSDLIKDPTRVPNVDRYRQVQIMEVLSTQGIKPTLDLLKYLPLKLWPWLFHVAVLRSSPKLFKRAERAYSCYSYVPAQKILDRGSYTKNSEVYRAIAEGHLSRPVS